MTFDFQSKIFGDIERQIKRPLTKLEKLFNLKENLLRQQHYFTTLLQALKKKLD